MARTNRHIACLDLTRESRFGSRPALGSKTPTFRFYGRAKGANWNACADSGAKYNGVYENRICTPLEEGAVGLRLGATREILGGQPRYADSDAVLEIVE
jgi:hypothetical protein